MVYFSTITLEASLTRLLMDQQMSAVKYVANDLEQKILLRMNSLQDVANNLPVNRIKDKKAIYNFLKQRIAIYRFFTNGVVVIDKNGFGVADFPVVSDRATADYRELEYFKEVLATGRAALGKPRIGRFTHKSGVAIAVPIKNAQGQLVAVLAGFMGLTDKIFFDPMLASFGKSGDLMLVSSEYQTVIADTHKDHELMSLDQTVHQSILGRCLDNISRTWFSKDLQGQNSLVSDVHILDNRWVVLGSLPIKEAFAPINEMKQKIYQLSAIILIFVGVIMWLMAYFQLKIVKSATHQLRKMAFGELPLHALQVNRSDEIGEMLVSFNKLQQQIQDTTAALQASHASYQNLFVHMSNGFALHEMIFNEQGDAINYRFIEVNSVFEQMTGLLKAQLIGKTVLDVMPTIERHWIENYGEVVKSGEPKTFESYAEPLGRWYKVIAYRPEPGKFAVTIEDTTSLKRAQKELEHLAHHDVLTGLPNRALFADRLQLALARAKRRNTMLAVGYMDLDKFKPVNDTYGHEAGDHLLLEVARRLKSSLRADDSISRFGGDEFAMLLTDISSHNELKELLDRLLSAIAAPYQIDGHYIEISMSVGVTLYPKDNSASDALLSHADNALYAAKELGGNCYQLFQ